MRLTLDFDKVFVSVSALEHPPGPVEVCRNIVEWAVDNATTRMNMIQLHHPTAQALSCMRLVSTIKGEFWS